MVSRYGLVAYASSLDQIGPFATNVADAALVTEIIAGHDPMDSTSIPQSAPSLVGAVAQGVAGMRIGRVTDLPSGAEPEVVAQLNAAFAALEAAGATIVDVTLPSLSYALTAYYIIAPAEASSNLARYDGVRYGLRDLPDGAGLQDMYAATRAAGFGAEVKRRILIGTYVLSAGFYDAYYTQAQKVRTLIAQDFKNAFTLCDVILAPTAPTAAFGLGEKSDDPLAMYLNDVFAVPASLAGLPAMSVPAGLNREGLPLGLQIVGKPFDEQGVLNAGLAIEQRAGFSAKPEKWW
jgi:aspartyl-tRNA(Asn)/glutamyl-tRNA(Gln) amidotransferase subunit A